jgi:hypothetical protein
VPVFSYEYWLVVNTSMNGTRFTLFQKIILIGIIIKPKVEIITSSVINDFLEAVTLLLFLRMHHSISL